MWGAWVTGMAAADAAILQRFERLGMGSIKPAEGLAALSAALSTPMPDAQASGNISQFWGNNERPCQII